MREPSTKLGKSNEGWTDYSVFVCGYMVNDENMSSIFLVSAAFSKTKYK